MKKSIGVILSNIVLQHQNYKGMSLKDLALLSANIDDMYKCCQDNNLSFSKDNLKHFITDLFTVDPEGLSLFPNHLPKLNYQDNGAPYQYNVEDYDDVTLDDLINEQPLKLKFKKNAGQTKYKARPKCVHDGCNKSAYFGLPFCPWCMKQIPPFVPNTDQRMMTSSSASVYPIIDFDSIISKPVTSGVTRMIGGVSKKFDLSDKVVDDGVIVVTQADVEAVKDVSKFIPKH